MAAPDDLSKLDNLEADSIDSALKARFQQDNIYTSINTLLVALNPYKQIPGIYSQETLTSYTEYAALARKPHVYTVAGNAYRGLLESRSQSLVISGESGAGKTETAKIILQFLARAATNGAATRVLETRIIASTPVLEAFGNARTVMNDNSSRYGKFLMLQFDVSGKMIGASVSTYLLEKSRLVVHAPGERNYHALYYLCAGPLAASLGLGAAGAHALLGPNAQADDAALFERTELALENVGFSLKERDSTWAVLAAALLLGDLTFGSAADADARVEQPETLGRIAELLGCDEAGLRFSLTKRKIRAGHEFIDTPSTSEQAGYMREGMVKAMYSKLFDWLVARVNESLALGEGKGAVGGGASGGGVGGGARFFIGILDIFGFEHFQTNSLEQLCINFTNEKLQGRFNDAIFASAAEENAVEGVAVDEADVADFENAEVLDLIERPATGILAMINEECVMPGGSDATLYDKLVSAHRSSRRFKKVLKARNQFEVVHYAGRVAYTATGMLGKNKDTVSEDMVVLMQGSELPFVRTVFADSADATALLVRKRGAKFQGVVAKFARQLDELMAVLDASDMHFIRCIKPNMDKAPGAWDADVVQRQLRCSGVLEVVRVFGMGYPDRVPHVEIVSRFACCLPNGRAPDENTPERAGCEAVLRALLAPKEFALGRSKAFLKSGVLAKLRQLREEQVARRAVYIQARARGLIQRQKWLVLWQAHLERKAAAAAEAQRRADEAECARLEAAEKARRDEEISRMNARERERALAEEAAKEAEKEAERREAERRKAEETESRREAEDALSLENGDWKKKLALSGGGGGAAAGTGAAGFALNMGKVNDAAKRASEQNEKTVNWTPRARPKDAPQQSARYQAEFKALPEDVLEYAVYLGMDPQVDQDLLWIAEEALLAPDPPGWVEMLDPKGLLYFYDENTGQSSRQHPLDEHYQNLYLKAKMQKAATGASGSAGGGDNATLTTDELQRRREALAQELERDSSSVGGEMGGTVTSIAQALSMATPRSSAALAEKFGISKPDTDVRVLLINPARLAEPARMTDTVFERAGGSGMFPRLTLKLVLSENYKAFAFSASKRVSSSRTEFVVSLDEQPEASASAGSSFAGRLRTNRKAQDYVLHDDSNDPYGLKTGQPRRELGLVVFKRKAIGPIQVDLVIPRVRRDGACAQFRPHTPEEAMMQLFKAGRVEHMMVLRGSIIVQPGALVELSLEAKGEPTQVVFRARKIPAGTWQMAYAHPLSAFQAFSFLISIVHNPLTAALDVTPTLGDAGGGGSVGSAIAAPKQLLEIAAEPGKGLPLVINASTLEGVGDAVYALAVREHKVFSGLYSGDIQVWHMDHYVNLPSGSKPEFNTLRGHTAPICALLVSNRLLISASDDKTIVTWDLNTLKKRGLLKGHTQRVRCLALHGTTLISAGNDKKLRVWDVDSCASLKVVDAHSNWVRSVAIYEGTHCISGSRDRTVKVWEMATWALLGTFSASSDVYCVVAGNGLVYAACADAKIRIWNLRTMQKSHMLIGHEAVVRTLYLCAETHTLFSASEDKKVKVWDLKSGECATLFGHTKFVRCISYDPQTKILYSAGDDAKIKTWEAREKK